MIGYEEVSCVSLRPIIRHEGKSERCRVSGDINERTDGFFADIVPSLHGSERRVRYLVAVTVRPPVETSAPDDIDLVWREIVAEIVTSHFGCPYFARFGVEPHENAVPESVRVLFRLGAVRFHDEDACPIGIFLHASIAARSDGNEDISIRKTEEGSGNVPASSRQIVYLHRVARSQCVCIVIVSDDLVCFRYIEPCLCSCTGEKKSMGTRKTREDDFGFVRGSGSVSVR